MRHRHNPYRAPELPPPPPQLDYPYPHKSGGYYIDHPSHDGSCIDFDGWVSPWELPEPRYETLALL